MHKLIETDCVLRNRIWITWVDWTLLDDSWCCQLNVYECSTKRNCIAIPLERVREWNKDGVSDHNCSNWIILNYHYSTFSKSKRLRMQHKEEYRI